MRAHFVTEFFVPGIPVQQGSKTAWVNKATQRAVLFDQNTLTLVPWRQAVTAIAADAHRSHPIEGAVSIVVEFRFVRPKTVKRDFPSVKPDIDKLLRSLFDGITDAGVWRDDSRVVTVAASKVYAERAGVLVRIGEYRKATP